MRLQARIDYGDEYVQPLLLEAIGQTLPAESFDLVKASPASSDQSLLEWAAYESLDFDRVLAAKTGAVLVNAYVIRKALIRKHFLAQISEAWIAKNPESALSRHVPRDTTAFELDYAEFLDDALVEAFELRASLDTNAAFEPAARRWWILKPGMSDRGQGIRLFSTEAELAGIFEEWEAENPSDDEDEEQDEDDSNDNEPPQAAASDHGIMTSQLRHFIAQPYLESPLLIGEAPYNSRKFHIRTYVVAHGALKVWVWRPMLALFASQPYAPPWQLGSDSNDQTEMREIHLTNTCVQSDSVGADAAVHPGSDEPPSSVHLFSDLPLAEHDHAAIQSQIQDTTAELFRAALAQPTHFQPLPNSFEIFGLDFLVTADDTADDTADTAGVTAHLLEVNAFPDFQQTGSRLAEVVVSGLFKAVVRQVIVPHFGFDSLPIREPETDGELALVLQLDMGRR